MRKQVEQGEEQRRWLFEAEPTHKGPVAVVLQRAKGVLSSAVCHFRHTVIATCLFAVPRHYGDTEGWITLGVIRHWRVRRPNALEQ